MKLLPKIHFKSDDYSDSIDDNSSHISFFDVEVYSNLFVVCYKYKDDENNKYPVIKMINPIKEDIEKILSLRSIEFNCRRYDNHIVYARLLGYSNFELFKLSQRIITGDRKAYFGEAYNLSYTDVYDYCSNDNKMSLKKLEIKLGIHHQEMGITWDKPVPRNKWEEVADYCANDVISTERVFNATQDDFMARGILADLADMSVNDTTNLFKY